MEFEQIQWLLLLVPLALLMWLVPSSGLRLPRRCLQLVLLVLLLCNPSLEMPRGGLQVFVLCDRSASHDDYAARNFNEWRSIIVKNKPGSREEVHFLDFASEVQKSSGNSQTPIYASRRQQTLLQNAINYVLQSRDPQRPCRILLLGDGYHVDSIEQAAAMLKLQGVEFDYRLSNSDPQADVRITAMRTPQRVRVQESFAVEVDISTPANYGEFKVEILRNDVSLGFYQIKPREGRAQLRLFDRLSEAQCSKYEARLVLAQQDSIVSNNIARSWTMASRGGRVLVVSPYTDDNVAALLRGMNFDVQLVQQQNFESAYLRGARAVILNNVSANYLDRNAMQALDFYVREQGGGLLMLGGEQSFGSGGYCGTLLEKLLPVSTELKSDKHKLLTAMAIALDCSGSMSAGVGGAGGVATKMDMANAAAIAAVECLGKSDFVAVYSVDTAATCRFGPGLLGKNLDAARKSIGSIAVSGGGIYVYSALKAGWEAIRKTEYGVKHLLLFADASDAEEPGDYQLLLQDIVAEGGSVSVVGLGSDKDCDAAFLQDVAKRGNGRCYFADDANLLPQIFAQETLSVSRKSFERKPCGVKPSGLWAEISSQPLQWYANSGAFNLCYAQPNARVLLLADNDYQNPLLATIQRGFGRSAAVCFACSGEHAGWITNWPDAAKMFQGLGSWLIGNELPVGVSLRSKIVGNELKIELFYDAQNPELQQQLLRNRARIKYSIDGKVEQLGWQRMESGYYSTSLLLKPGESVLGALQFGEHALDFGPLSLGVDAEWSYDSSKHQELAVLSSLSGGLGLLDLAQVWRSYKHSDYTNIRLELLLLLLLVFAYDVLASRFGWKLCPAFVRALPSRLRTLWQTWSEARRTKNAVRRDAGRSTAKVHKTIIEQSQDNSKLNETAAAAAEPKAAAQSAAEPGEALQQRRSRFERAKRN